MRRHLVDNLGFNVTEVKDRNYFHSIYFRIPGGVFLFSGGLIGAEVDKSFYQGNFKNTPIFLGCSDVDSHVPLHRVQESTVVFREMGAQVTERIYPNAPHSVFADEIAFANAILSQ